MVEINRDIDYCEQCLRKYGEWFNSPLQYLRVRTSARACGPATLSSPFTSQAATCTTWH